MTRKIQFKLGKYYHIYNRGVDKRIIFEKQYDYRRFLALLYLCNGEKPTSFWLTQPLRSPTSQWSSIDRGVPLVAIGAYCLMPNHFHLLIRELQLRGVSRFMQKLSTAYTMYFNLSRERSGALFQGKFKAKDVNSDEYLKYLFSYIHLNPSELTNSRNKEKFLSSYSYSSYSDYYEGNRDIECVLMPSEFPNYFLDRNKFQQYIQEWIRYKYTVEVGA
ncbi:MAG: transposase [Patescibacteria group bacterium]